MLIHTAQDATINISVARAQSTHIRFTPAIRRILVSLRGQTNVSLRTTSRRKITINDTINHIQSSFQTIVVLGQGTILAPQCFIAHL
jgi:hypothetical protein